MGEFDSTPEAVNGAAASGAPRLAVLLCALVLFVVNLIVIWPLFDVEYLAYNGSIEGTFIAIPRLMAKYPGQWSWWPFWNGGLPFENAYLPFTHWVVAAFIRLTGIPAARSFHMVTAAVYALGAVSLFWMALAVGRRLAAAFTAALAYSCVSLSALLIPAIGMDAGSPLNLRRLQVLVFYGESPHTWELVLFPAAVVCFARALGGGRAGWKILAGALAGCVLLSSAFGAVALVLALVSWLLVYPSRRWWKRPLTAGAIGVLSYCWVSPWLSPAMLRASRANAATSGGDFRYNTASWLALAGLCVTYVVAWFLMRRVRVPRHVRFFALLTWFPAGVMFLWYGWRVHVMPQPWRYQLEMDMFLPLAVVFGASALLDRCPRRVRATVTACVLAALVFQSAWAVRYARGLIRTADPRGLGEYRIAQWMDRNRPARRAFISGSGSLLYNAFTDNPQLHGGHEQYSSNPFLGTVAFAIYSGMNAGERDAEYSIFWLKAFGTGLISVPGPESNDAYKPFAHPKKFDGVLPLVWREGGDSIYEVPLRSVSLAHVIPASAVVVRRPIHGLDTAPVEPYVAALDDSRYPPAEFRWKTLSEAAIRAVVQPGQVVAVQVTYERGWEAWANGRPAPVRGDAIGQTVIDAGCAGPCDISLRYTGGYERILTRSLSAMAMLAAVAFAWRGRAARRARDGMPHA